MKQKHLKFWDIIDRMRSRVPIEQLVEFIISFAYIYGNNNNLFGGGSTEYLNIAEETLKRIPSDLEVDLINEFDETSASELRDFLYELLFVGSRDIEYSDKNLSELVLNLLELKNNDQIFDLGSGLGTFLVSSYMHSINNNIKLDKIFGMDINYNNIAFSNMLLEMLIVEDNLEQYEFAYYGNVLTDNFHYRYNKGYVFPPFGMRFGGSDSNFRTSFNNIQLTTKNTYDWIFVDKLLKNLKGENPRAVALVSGRALFNAADADYRDALIDSGLLEGIIELPSGVIENVSSKAFLLIFSENNTKVKFVDASSLNGTNSSYIKNTMVLYNNKEVDYKANDEVKELKNWTPSTVLIDIKKYKNGVLLSEVAELRTGSQYTLRNFKDKLTDDKTEYRILTSSDIKDGLIYTDDLPYIINDDNKLDRHMINENDVIITSKSSKVKIAVIDFDSEEKIIVTGGMIIVSPDITRLNPTFLKMFLESTQGQNILRSIQKGSTVVTINSKDLAEIIIPLPNIRFQFKVAQKYNNKLSSLLAFKNEISKIQNDLENFYEEEVDVGDV